MPRKRKPGRPKGDKALRPRKGSLRARIVDAYDAGEFSSTAQLAGVLRTKARPCTTMDVCNALTRWRPGWYEKMHGSAHE